LNLTPGQLREVLDLSEDAYRHWRRALSPLAGRNGYRPCFSHGDLLAIAVIKALIDEAGVRVGLLEPISAELFRLCQRAPWAALERSALVIVPGAARISVVPDSQQSLNGESAIAIHVPCGPIVGRLRARLLADQYLDSQQTLRFPPAAVGGDRRSAGDNS